MSVLTPCLPVQSKPRCLSTLLSYWTVERPCLHTTQTHSSATLAAVLLPACWLGLPASGCTSRHQGMEAACFLHAGALLCNACRVGRAIEQYLLVTHTFLSLAATHG
jgi:hypothetical protein